MPKTLYITKQLRVKLTPAEKLDVADKISKCQEEIDYIEKLKKKVNTLREEMSGLNDTYMHGTQKPVKCMVELFKPHDGLKTITRMDTGEEVAIEDMTAEDEQRAMFDADGNANTDESDDGEDAEYKMLAGGQRELNPHYEVVDDESEED